MSTRREFYFGNLLDKYVKGTCIFSAIAAIIIGISYMEDRVTKSVVIEINDKLEFIQSIKQQHHLDVKDLQSDILINALNIQDNSDVLKEIKAQLHSEN